MEDSKQVVLQPVPEARADDSLPVFFAIGMVINIALMIAYLVWAYRQWGKKEKQGN